MNLIFFICFFLDADLNIVHLGDSDDSSVLPPSTEYSGGQTQSMPSTFNDFEDDSDEELEEIEEIPLDDSYEDMLHNLGKIWSEATVRHNISIEGASYLWRTAFKFIGTILQKKEDIGNTRKLPQFKHLRRKIMNKSVPPVKIRLAYLNLDTGLEETPPPSLIGPHKAYSDVTKYQKLYEISSVSIRDVLQVHSKN